MEALKNPSTGKEEPKQDFIAQNRIFRDEQGQGYIKIADEDEKWVVVPIKGKKLPRLLLRRFYKHDRVIPKKKEIDNMIRLIEAYADIAPKQKMPLRVAWEEGRIFYNLGDALGNVVEVGPGSWQKQQNSPVLFREYAIGTQQVLPLSDQAMSPDRLFDFVNIADPQERLLFAVYLVSCFIPEIAHPAAMVFGGAGAAKSSIARVVKQLVDPAGAITVGFPAHEVELAQFLSHNYYCAFDNLSNISKKQSDMLCTAVTGGNFVKRTAYSDQEDTVFVFKNCLAFTGIHLVAEETDLLDRILLFELQSIDEDCRQLEEDFLRNFEEARPHILGWIFDTLAKALRIFPKISVTKLPRLADFYKWGIAITEAMGYERARFETAFAQNRAKINWSVIEANSLATVITDLMKSKKTWEGTVSQLFDLLIRKYDGRQLPKAPNQLSRSLKEIEAALKNAGIAVQWERYTNTNKTKVTLSRR